MNDLECEAEEVVLDLGIGLVHVEGELDDDLCVCFGGPLCVALLGLEFLLART